eukprot:4994286-Pleurochrysis_carterae.AAC.2
MAMDEGPILAPMLRLVAQSDVTPGGGDALRACVASLLGLSSETVPHFVREAGSEYWHALQQHAHAHGMAVLKQPLVDNRLPHATTAGVLCILRGVSPRGEHGHVVLAAVAADGLSFRMVHDPHPGAAFLKPPYTWAAFYTPLFPPAAVAPTCSSSHEPLPAEAASLFNRLQPLLAGAGFDLMAPMLAGWYDDEEHIAPLPKEHKLGCPPGSLLRPPAYTRVPDGLECAVHACAAARPLPRLVSTPDRTQDLRSASRQHACDLGEPHLRTQRGLVRHTRRNVCSLSLAAGHVPLATCR